MRWENSPNTEDEKPSNSLSMIDRFEKNGLQHIRRFPINKYILRIREDIHSYNCVTNLPNA